MTDMIEAMPYSIPRYRVELVRESTITMEYQRHHNAGGVYRWANPAIFSRADRELFVVAGIDSKNRVIGVNVASVGTLCSGLVHPREVLKPLILMNSRACIAMHNHPSGDPLPSGDDNAVTHRLYQACKLIGIDLIDHVICGETSYYSYADEGKLASDY